MTSEKWHNFTEAELYALNNALEFAQCEFAKRATPGQQWAHEWEDNQAVAKNLQAQVRSELQTRAGS